MPSLALFRLYVDELAQTGWHQSSGVVGGQSKAHGTVQRSTMKGGVAEIYHMTSPTEPPTVEQICAHCNNM